MYGTVEIPIAEKKAPPGQDEVILTLISLVSNIDLRLFEETLLEKSPIYEGFLQLPGTGHSYVCPTDELITKFHDRFVALPDIYEAKHRKVSKQRSRGHRADGRTNK